jgi:hypothetical protein
VPEGLRAYRCTRQQYPGIANGSVVEVSEAEWDRPRSISKRLSRHEDVIPVMQKQGGGSIINISSILHLGIPYVSMGHQRPREPRPHHGGAVSRDHVG